MATAAKLTTRLTALAVLDAQMRNTQREQVVSLKRKGTYPSLFRRLTLEHRASA